GRSTRGSTACRSIPPGSVVTQDPTVSQCDVNEESTGIAVLERPCSELDLVAGFDRGGLPACADQIGRGVHFKGPGLCAAFAVRHLDFQPRVWIGPLELFNDSFLRDCFCLIDARCGMVGISCNRDTKCNNQ